MSSKKGGVILAGIAGTWLGAAAAHAARPVLGGEATYGVSGGSVLVHYATSGVDAPPATDGNGDGVPDFVAEVAQTADSALTRYLALGFRRPLSDGTEGGDGRIDFYLRNLNNADGNAGTDSCAGARCIGFATAENDFAGYSYSTVTEGIRSVIPHELFHLVQMAYAAGQPGAWSEGSAVWAVEELYGAGNSDFERFLPSFLTKSFRPLERPAGGFGDGYPYGAALWSYFLSHRHDATFLVEAWQASETATFLDAIDATLLRRSSTLEDAFIEMTQWNWFTGARAAGGGYPDASAWPQVPVEPALTTALGPAKLYVEGLSARYVPVTIAGEAQQLVVKPTGGIKLAGWVVADGGGLADGVELISGAGGSLAVTLSPGAYTLVLTGLSRNTITTEVGVELTAPPVKEDEDDGGGCSATGTGAGGWPLGLASLALLSLLSRKNELRRRRRAVDVGAMSASSD